MKFNESHVKSIEFTYDEIIKALVTYYSLENEVDGNTEWDVKLRVYDRTATLSISFDNNFEA